MNEKQENNGFRYTYSAAEQSELKRIREKYTPPSTSEAEDKMERLRRLDASVTQGAQVVALVFGVIGALILGFGMSLVLSELGDKLGLARNLAIWIGVGVGTIGGVLVALAYPLYDLTVKRRKRRLAPEILRLTDELMK